MLDKYKICGIIKKKEKKPCLENDLARNASAEDLGEAVKPIGEISSLDACAEVIDYEVL